MDCPLHLSECTCENLPALEGDDVETLLRELAAGPGHCWDQQLWDAPVKVLNLGRSLYGTVHVSYLGTWANKETSLFSFNGSPTVSLQQLQKLQRALCLPQRQGWRLEEPTEPGGERVLWLAEVAQIKGYATPMLHLGSARPLVPAACAKHVFDEVIHETVKPTGPTTLRVWWSPKKLPPLEYFNTAEALATPVSTLNGWLTALSESPEEQDEPVWSSSSDSSDEQETDSD